MTLLLPAEDEHTDAEALLARMMSPPFFPIGPHQLRGDWRFGPVPCGPFEAEGFTVVARDVPTRAGAPWGSG